MRKKLKYILEIEVEQCGDISEDELCEMVKSELNDSMISVVVDSEERDIQVFVEAWSYERAE